MFKPIFKIALIVIAFFAAGISQEKEFKALQLEKNLYTVSGVSGGNIVFLVSGDGVLVVDAGYYVSDGEAIVKTIRTVTDQPVKYLIYTHFHRDHINGAAGFSENITVIGHENIKENIINFNEERLNNDIEKVFPEYIKKEKEKISELKKANSPELESHQKQLKSLVDHLENIKKIKFRYPDQTFRDSLLLKMGNEEVLLKYMGNAHTSDNIVVIFKNQNTIHVGDLIFNKIVPYVIPEHGANTQKWMNVLYNLHEQGFKTVIPGHGEITDNNGILKMAEYFKALRSQVEKGLKNKMPLTEIQKDQSLLETQGISYSAQFPKNIEAIYNELTQ